MSLKLKNSKTIHDLRDKEWGTPEKKEIPSY